MASAVPELPVGAAATESSPCHGQEPSSASDPSSPADSWASDASRLLAGDPGHKHAEETPPARNAQDPVYEHRVQNFRKFISGLMLKIATIETYETEETDMRTVQYLATTVLNPSLRYPLDAFLECEEFLRNASCTVNSYCDSLRLNGAADFTIKTPIDLRPLPKRFGEPLMMSPATVYPRTPEYSHSPPQEQSCASAAVDDGQDIPDILRREMSHLDPPFSFQLDPIQNFGSKTTKILCILDVGDLPNVPPITVTVLEDYPGSSPLFLASQSQYASTKFFADVLSAFKDSRNKLPRPYSLTTLLNTWESSVRRSAEQCCREHEIQDEVADSQSDASLAGSSPVHNESGN